MITPDGKTAYVLYNNSTVVTPISTATNLAARSVQAGTGPIAITPDGKTVYVANWNTGTVIPICTATSTLDQPIKVGRNPSDIAIAP